MELRVFSMKAYPTMYEDVLEEMVKQQFILGVRNSITREILIVKLPENFKDAIEFARLSELAGRTARGNPPPSNKNVFVAMHFEILINLVLITISSRRVQEISIVIILIARQLY